MQMGLLGLGTHGANISLCIDKLAKLSIGHDRAPATKLNGLTQPALSYDRIGKGLAPRGLRM